MEAKNGSQIVAIALMLSLLMPIVGQQQPTPSQKPPEQDEELRVDVNLVQIDVVVTDKQGQQITDLRPDDFEIMEDGKRQQITNFSYIAAGEPKLDQPTTVAGDSSSGKNGAPVKPARLGRAQVRRTIALVVDDLGLSFESIVGVRKALKRFVDEQMQPNDMVAILRTGGGIGALQQVTSDKRQLYAAIERVRWNPQGRGRINSSGGIDPRASEIDYDQKDSAQVIGEMEDAREDIYAVGTMGAVNSIVQGLSEMPGRKSLVLISEAFRLFTIQGRNVRLVEAMARLTDQANAASTTIYTLDASGLQTLSLEAGDRYSAAYSISAQALSAAEAASGNLGGVARPNPPRSVDRVDSLSSRAELDSGDAFRKLRALESQRENRRFEAQSVLSYLAQRTGGLFTHNRNDLAAGIQRIMEDQKGYYLIGYRPNNPPIDPSTGRRHFRKLAVKVNRSGLTTRARSGYYGITDEEKRMVPRTREEQLAKALVSPFASDDVRVRLTSLFGDEPGGGAFMRSLLHIDGRNLLFTEGASGVRKAELEIVAVAFGSNGQVVDQLSYPQTVSVSDNDAYQRLLQNGLTYILNFPIKRAGAYQMRVAVRDGTSEQVGTAAQFVEVPDLSKNQLALSGIVLSGIDQAAVSMTSTSAPAARPATIEPDPRTGPAVRRLSQGMVLDYRYHIYNAKLDAAGRPQLQTQMRLFRDDQQVFTGKVLPFSPTDQTDLKRLRMIGRLRIGPELTSGDYALQVIVIDNLAPENRRTTTQWIDFEILK